jgi:hypothetical protein
MGERTLRRLLIIGASSAAKAAARKGASPETWLGRMLARKPRMLVAVALANKIALHRLGADGARRNVSSFGRGGVTVAKARGLSEVGRSEGGMAQQSVRRAWENQECPKRLERAKATWTQAANSIKASGVRTAASTGRTHGSTSTTRSFLPRFFLHRMGRPHTDIGWLPESGRSQNPSYRP